MFLCPSANLSLDCATKPMLLPWIKNSSATEALQSIPTAMLDITLATCCPALNPCSDKDLDQTKSTMPSLDTGSRVGCRLNRCHVDVFVPLASNIVRGALGGLSGLLALDYICHHCRQQRLLHDY